MMIYDACLQSIRFHQRLVRNLKATSGRRWRQRRRCCCCCCMRCRCCCCCMRRRCCCMHATCVDVQSGVWTSSFCWWKLLLTVHIRKVSAKFAFLKQSKLFLVLLHRRWKSERRRSKANQRRRLPGLVWQIFFSSPSRVASNLEGWWWVWE